jgi:16S rRNA pseudouridine516 synthase
MIIRIDKWISDLTAYSRKEARELVKQGRVTRNNDKMKSPSEKADTSKDQIALDHELLVYEEALYFMMNKPMGVITATEDPVHKTVVDLLEAVHRKRVFPAGRLDKDTEGLLILTSDGDYAHRLMHPGKHVNKIYIATVNEDLTDDLVDLFSQGVDIGDYITRPSTLTILEPRMCLVEISEGKYHQVKRMLLAHGYQVVALKRLSIGNLVLDEDIPAGEYRVMSEKEISDALVVNHLK